MTAAEIDLLLTGAEAAVLDAVDPGAVLADLAALVAIPSVGGTDAEHEVQHWCARRLAGLGADVDHWRIDLDAECWVELATGWVCGSDALFQEILRTRRWGQRSRRMYDRRVQEPRLTSPWSAASGAPLEPAIVDEMRRALSRRYGVDLDSAGFNLYRDGADGVAWHGDRILKAFGRSAHLGRGFRAQAKQLQQTELAKARMVSVLWATVLALPEIAIGICLLLGVQQVAAGTLTAGALIAFFTVAIILRWPVDSLGWMLTSLNDAATATDRFFEVMDQPVTITSPNAPVPQ